MLIKKTAIKKTRIGTPYNRARKTKSTIEQEKALRDQLHIEIENKSKACSNPTYNCTVPRLDGFEFCIRHILLDPNAPYKQCTYIYPTNGKICTQAAPKYDNKKESTAALTNYCFEHSRLVQLNKTHEIVGQYKQVETNEAYLNDLTHHIKLEKQTSPVHHADTDEEIDVVSSNTEPFINYVHVAKFDSKNDDKEKRKILDYASDSSSDADLPTINNTWKGHEWDNSDNESVDSQNEDYLKHAGIYTTEESTMITKQKMMRLQSLYTGQIYRLQHLLKEKRRKYLQSIRKERETLCSIHDQPKNTPEERKLYEKLKALNHYHKRHGIEAVLQKKYNERRLKANEISVSHKGPLYTKCIFTEGGVKCGERALPCCKYCRKHILEDKKQILFKACGVEKSGIVCQEPVPNIFEDSTCVLHINFPGQKNYTQKKFESETEEEDDDNAKKIDKICVEIKNENCIMDMDSSNIITATIDNNKLDKKSESDINIQLLNANTKDNETNQNHNNDEINGKKYNVEMIPVDDIKNNISIVHNNREESPNDLKNENEMMVSINDKKEKSIKPDPEHENNEDKQSENKNNEANNISDEEKIIDNNIQNGNVA